MRRERMKNTNFSLLHAVHEIVKDDNVESDLPKALRYGLLLNKRHTSGATTDNVQDFAIEENRKPRIPAYPDLPDDASFIGAVALSWTNPDYARQRYDQINFSAYEELLFHDGEDMNLKTALRFMRVPSDESLKAELMEHLRSIVRRYPNDQVIQFFSTRLMNAMNKFEESA